MFQEKARDYVKTNGKNTPEPEKNYVNLKQLIQIISRF